MCAMFLAQASGLITSKAPRNPSERELELQREL